MREKFGGTKASTSGTVGFSPVIAAKAASMFDETATDSPFDLDFIANVPESSTFTAACVNMAAEEVKSSDGNDGSSCDACVHVSGAVVSIFVKTNEPPTAIAENAEISRCLRKISSSESSFGSISAIFRFVLLGHFATLECNFWGLRMNV
jgi:hypothetical protein